MENLFWIGLIGALVALSFAWVQRSKVMKASEGDEKMVKIAAAIRSGANAYQDFAACNLFFEFCNVFFSCKSIHFIPLSS